MTAHTLFANFLAKNPLPTAHTAYKAWLEHLNADIDADVCQNTHAIETLFAVRTLAVEHLVVGLFERANLGKHCALFAVGGFARGEMLPYSDVDMLLIYDDSQDAPADFITTLWDTGLAPAIALRPTNDHACVKDITIATNLSESRFLTGRTDFANLPTSWVKQHWDIHAFFAEKSQEKHDRHAQFGSTEYTLEPNIKTSVGTLRDIHFLHWIGKFYFGLPPQATLADLVAMGFLTQDECTTLMSAKHFFWQIRHHLHTLADKADDKLSFGMQKLLAERMGFGQVIGNDTTAPERLMKCYYHHAMTVATLTQMLGELFYEAYLEPTHQSTPLDDDFFVILKKDHRAIGVIDPTLFAKNSSALLGIFLAMGKHAIKHIAPATLRLLRTHSQDIDEHFRQNHACQALFLANLNEPNFLFHRLRLMKRTGILGAYLPSFAKITGLMQYDLFHRYTVDAHTLLLIRILHRFGQNDDFGVINTIYTELDNKLPLVIAGLFHDIAKGRGGDHSELGAVDVREFCLSHRLPKDDADLAEWLVRHHLVMSITAQKKDIFDPDVINDFAQFVGDIRHLDTLYLLTVADMNATNSQLWNNWRASLLKKLYLATHHVLSTGTKTISPSTLIAQSQEKALALITLKLGKTLPNVHAQTYALWQDLPQEYFLKESPKDIAWHSIALLSHDRQSPLVLVRPHKDKSLHAHQLFIYTADKPNLFAVTVMILDYFGFGVYGANILTDRQGFALDSYVIVNKALANKSILDDTLTATPQSDTTALIACLGTSLQDPESFLQNPLHAKARASTRLQHFLIATQVFFDNTGNQHHLHIHTKDRPSLLASIGMGFYELGLAVHSAKITTLGERAEDVFLVSEPDGTALSETRQHTIISTLKTLLDD